MSTTTQTHSGSEKPNKNKLLFLSLGILAAGAISFFGIQYFSKNKKKRKTETLPETKPTKATTTVKKTKTVSPPPKQAKPLVKATVKQTSKTPEVKLIEFPLKKGSRGSKVKALQEALIAKHGKSILAKSGADGIFGNEVISALKKLKLPEIISLAQYNAILGLNKADAQQGKVNPTLIITTQETKVWKDPKTFVAVPINMVLGKQITTRGKFTLFENAAKHFLVETSHIKTYTA